ncbi:MAG: hypothetical protein JST36_02045 [Bacteroidetes bacterium]|nr:hypothetical protein [Bacteroidota bacterium]
MKPTMPDNFLKGLDPQQQANCNSGLKDNGRAVEMVHGRSVFYRFAGYCDLYQAANSVLGPWWFSEAVYNSWLIRYRRMRSEQNISFSDFARAQLALPDSWNSKEGLYRMTIGAGKQVEALVGFGRHQPLSGSRDQVLPNGKINETPNVFLIGGEKQYYFKVDDIKCFKIEKII